jgi:uncharacterized protein with PQ loop repeat
MDLSIPVLAGVVSTTIFASSMLPMLVKAARTRNLGSYSLGNILLSNLGNVIHSVYVFHLPPGPVWVLHTFYLVSTALMLFWYVRYASAEVRAALRRLRRITHARSPSALRTSPEAPPGPSGRQ